MNQEIRFSAPWSIAVKIITIVVVALLLGVALIGSRTLPDSTPSLARIAATFLPLAILAGTLPFIVRSYVLGDGELRIERFGWSNRFTIAQIESTEVNPEAMRWSIRLCGSGGLFGFFGWFRNKTLGTYRAYCTDLKNTVVVKLKDRTIVVTPHDPVRFVKEIQQRLKPASDRPKMRGRA